VAAGVAMSLVVQEVRGVPQHDVAVGDGLGGDGEVVDVTASTRDHPRERYLVAVTTSGDVTRYPRRRRNSGRSRALTPLLSPPSPHHR
jgi:hypothetical protein